MNRKMVFGTAGKIVCAEALILIIPLIVSLIYNEKCATSFLITIAISAIVGAALVFFGKTENEVIYAKEGFLTVSLSWILLSLIGALPFTISGEIPNYVDAVFETVSGFTTTGASILTNIEAMSKGMLFWRSLTHWVGGMGVLVFVMAILPNVSKRSIHIMRAEVPGPVKGKLVPKMRDTAKILYLIYIALTVIEIIFLLAGKMSLFDSIVHALGTAGTGGFGAKADSIGSYSDYLQWVITIFMLLFGINFNVYYLLLTRHFKPVFKSSELWTYIGVAVFAVVAITFNIHHMYESIPETIKQASFQVASIMTTTGYSTTDFNLWPTFAKAILFALSLIGACAGSTAGGFKVTRVVILFKKIRSEMKRLAHPRTVKVVNFEGKRLEESTTTGVTVYLAIYIVCYVAVFLAISFFDNFDFETNFTAVSACFNNIGPGLGKVGPMGSFDCYSIASKIILTISMLLGRLEIFPLIIAFMPATWSKVK
ncbi:MAG: TrkH family potassium uptake protein [Ruminococcaceae bacterium]|nr:TrkH family potassium uptake protein [Oscillospiraceae bacterium]